MRTTKIVATLGPSSDSPEVIRKLFEAGANVFRLNASHGNQQEHGERIRRVRALSDEMGIHAGILLDLQGPKIRLGQFAGGGCTLATGSEFTITTDRILGNCEKASTGYLNFARDVKPGDRVLLNDGSVELRVLYSDGISAHCLVVTGGKISDRKGINLPGVAVSTPSLTEKDLADLHFGLEAGIDLVALSFVRNPEDVQALRTVLQTAGSRIPIVAKIEKPEAWTQIDAIIEAADGVMVARGDLGVEMALERVPAIQKSLIRRARARGRFIITATQMLESMIENPLPTRAEVSDVANAIYDGTDAVMLSAETSAGSYPVESVRMMARIAQEAENSIRRQGFKEPPSNANPSHAEIVADAAYRAARTAGVAAIAVFTSTGFSARLIARSRPPVPIYAFTSSQEVARRLSIIYAVHPVLVTEGTTTDEMLSQVDSTLTARNWVQPKDSIVFVAGQPIGASGTTNLMKLHRIGVG